jgi:hypothetical protein
LLRSESHFSLETDPALIPPLLRHVSDNLRRMSMCNETGLIRVTMALCEALLSAMVHGNLEIDPTDCTLDENACRKLIELRRHARPYCDRRVHVIAKEMLHEARYTIRYDGPGAALWQLFGTSDAAALAAGDTGLLLIRMLMDEVIPNEQGNEITLVKRRDR